MILAIVASLLIAGVVPALAQETGRRTRGDGIGTAGDAPTGRPHVFPYLVREDCLRQLVDPARGSRSRGEGIGTAGDAPADCVSRAAAGPAASPCRAAARAEGTRTRGDGAGTAGDAPAVPRCFDRL